MNQVSNPQLPLILRKEYLRRQQKVIAALKSRMFTKRRNELRGPGNKRCCLGVICEVFQDETGKGVWKRNGSGYAFVAEAHNETHPYCNSIGLPKPVGEWLGHDEPDGVISDIQLLDQSLGYQHASNLNDSTDLSLEEIGAVLQADWQPAWATIENK